MQSKGEYSGIFLPLLIPANECSTGGRFNSPIVIAWSNAGYNHFIPLVPIKDRPLPRLPFYLRPKVGKLLVGKHANLIKDFLDFLLH